MGALEKCQPFDTVEVNEAKAGVRISMGALEKCQPFDTIEVLEAKAGVRISMGALRRKGGFLLKSETPLNLTNEILVFLQENLTTENTEILKKFSLWSPPAPAPGAGVCALWFILFGFGLSELG